MQCWCLQILSHGTCCHHPAAASHAEDLPAVAVATATCLQPATNTQPYCTTTPCGCMEAWLTCRRGPTSGGGTLVRFISTVHNYTCTTPWSVKVKLHPFLDICAIKWLDQLTRNDSVVLPCYQLNSQPRESHISSGRDWLQCELTPDHLIHIPLLC